MKPKAFNSMVNNLSWIVCIAFILPFIYSCEKEEEEIQKEGKKCELNIDISKNHYTNYYKYKDPLNNGGDCTYYTEEYTTESNSFIIEDLGIDTIHGYYGEIFIGKVRKVTIDSAGHKFYKYDEGCVDEFYIYNPPSDEVCTTIYSGKSFLVPAGPALYGSEYTVGNLLDMDWLEEVEADSTGGRFIAAYSLHEEESKITFAYYSN